MEAGVRDVMTLKSFFLNVCVSLQGDRFCRVKGTPTQVFNAHGRRQQGETSVGIVYVPGFASVPTLQSPGLLGQVARQHGCDFVRFHFPELLDDPSGLSYAGMIRRTTDVVLEMPHRQVVVVASSFGAGLIPWVVKGVQKQYPDKIAGVFGWAAMPPAAVWDLVNAQPGMDDFSPTNPLVVRAPTLPRPFRMTQSQYYGLVPYLDFPPRVKLAADDRVSLLLGTADPVATEKHTLALARALMPGDSAYTLYKGGHRPPEQLIRTELSGLIQRVQTHRPPEFSISIA